MFKLTGTLKVIKDTVQVTEKFSKREFVVSENSSMYPQEIAFQAAQDKCSMLDGYSEGENVEVSFNLRGREWTSPQGEVKYFNRFIYRLVCFHTNVGTIIGKCRVKIYKGFTFWSSFP